MTKNLDSEKVRNKEIFRLINEVVSSFIDALDKPFSSEYGSLQDRIKTIVEADSSFIAEILLKRPDLNSKKLSCCLLKTKKYLQFITKANISQNPPHASTQEGYREELVSFLERMLRERDHMQNRKSFRQEGLERHFNDFLKREYLRYERYLYDNSASDFVICPLENFIGPPKMIDFGDHLAIRKITQDEFHSLAEAQARYEGGPTSYPEFVIYIPSNRDWMKDVTTILTALRLFKKGAVGLKKAYYGYAFPSRPWRILEPPVETKFLKEKSESLYVSSNSESKDIICVFSTLEKTRNAGYLSVALRRSNLAYQRDRPEDRFIDCFVSLESLYSKTSGQGEVTHKISTRASRVLAEKFEDRQKKRSRLKDLYRLRSKIVHGDQVRLRQEDVKELEEIARRSLKWFIYHEDYANHNKIIDELDLGS